MTRLCSFGALMFSLLLFGCGGGGGGGGGDDDIVANNPPEIAGKSIDYARSGKVYEFTPTTFDPENATLRYQIRNQPAWTEFDETTGTLRGTPDDIVVGQYDDIVISVSDGTNVVSLPPFSLKVMYGEVGRSNVQLDPLATVTNTPDGYDVVGDAKIHRRTGKSLHQSWWPDIQRLPGNYGASIRLLETRPLVR